MRQAVRDGGLRARMGQGPFSYLDENYVSILGGPEAAAGAGTSVIMVATGRVGYLGPVSEALRRNGLRFRVRLA